jgi:hypothetical protein
MSIEEFNDHEGVEYQVGQDGNAAVVPDQMLLDDIKEDGPLEELHKEVPDPEIKGDDDVLFDNNGDDLE